jgi:putative ABC transport system permease protein
MTMWGLALACVKTKRLRSLMMVSSVAVAIGMAVSMYAMVKHINKLMALWSDDNDYLLVMPAISGAGKLPAAFINQVREVPDAEPVVWAYGKVKPITPDRYEYVIYGANAEVVRYNPPGWFDVSKETADCWVGARQAIIPKEEVAQHFGWKDGELVTLNTTLGALPVTICGVARGLAEPRILIHTEYLEEIRKQRSPKDVGFVNLIWVKAPAPKRTEVAAAIDEQFANSAMPTATRISSESSNANWKEQFGVADLVTLIAIVTTIVTCLVTTNTMMITMRERRAEFGSLRAMGFRRGRVLRMVLLESIIVWWIGGAIGMIGATIFFHFGEISAASPAGRVVLHFQIDPGSCAWGFLGATLLAIVTALLPGVQTARLRILDAMANN